MRSSGTEHCEPPDCEPALFANLYFGLRQPSPRACETWRTREALHGITKKGTLVAKVGFLRLASLGVLLLSGVMQVALAQERFTREVTFDIAAQSVEAALLEFSKQADVQVMVGGALNGQKTDGVKGKLSVTEGLRQLLKNTGLEYQTEGNTVTIRSVAAAKADARVRPLLDAVTLASRDAAGEAARSSIPPNEAKVADVDPLDTIVVTGTHIRGQAPVGSQLISLDRTEINRSGFSTVQGIVQSIPQNFGGGVSEDTFLGLEAGTNNARSTAVNLRGLGAAATLVLINGRRLASSGTEGAFTDVSSVPLTAIDRIDVLTDGASAVYGSDAIGGVVNFRMRQALDGAQTEARYGAVTSGSEKEYQLGQAFGLNWSSGSGVLAYEYFLREPLLASERDESASNDLRSFGGSDFSDFFNNPGTITSGSQTWAIPSGQDGSALTPADLIPGTRNAGNRNEGRELYARQERHSLYATATSSIDDRADVFIDGLFTKREVGVDNGGQSATLQVPNTNPFYVNPTGGTGRVTVRYRLNDDFGPRHLDVDVKTANVGAGINISFGDSWHVTAQAMYSREDVDQKQDTFNSAAMNAALADPNPLTAFNPFADGSYTNPETLARIRADSIFETQSDLRSAGVTADGRLWGVGDRNARLALGVEVRKPSFESMLRSPTGLATNASFEREVRSGFAELVMPFVGTSNSRPGMRALDVSLAGRFEDYSDFGSATTPKVGVTWSPALGFKLRGTWSNSFRAPGLADLDETNNFSLIDETPDPLSTTGTSPVLLWLGKNADLEEETATSYSFGVEYEPEQVAGLSLSANYFRVKFEDRIQAVPDSASWLLEPRFASVVTRSPSAEDRTRVCSRSTFVGTLSDCTDAPVAAIIDARVINTAISEVSGLDLIGSYLFDTSVGTFEARLNATYLLDYSQALTRLESPIDIRNTANNPIDLRLRGSLSWSRRGLSATAFVNYSDSYIDNITVPQRGIDSWTTVDLQLAYETRESGGLLDNFTVALNAQNVLDEDPPFFNNPLGVAYDPENAELLGRFLSLQLRKSW